jgi:hypothetical protein
MGCEFDIAQNPDIILFQWVDRFHTNHYYSSLFHPLSRKNASFQKVPPNRGMTDRWSGLFSEAFFRLTNGADHPHIMREFR